MATINKLVLNIFTKHENLDINTAAFATVRKGEDVIANNVQIAKGEVEENQAHAPVTVPLNPSVDSSENLTIEIIYPGIPSNDDPHWRMTFDVDAISTDGAEFDCDVNLAQSPIFSDDKGSHLNFERVEGRSSGRLPLKIS